MMCLTLSVDISDCDEKQCWNVDVVGEKCCVCKFLAGDFDVVLGRKDREVGGDGFSFMRVFGANYGSCRGHMSELCLVLRDSITETCSR
jgi:hypothetical protein